MTDITLRDLAQDICNDCDGAWWGCSETDYLGHIAAYIGRLEARVDETRRSLRVKTAAYDLVRVDLDRAVELLTEGLEYRETGDMGSFKSRVREFLEAVE